MVSLSQRLGGSIPCAINTVDLPIPLAPPVTIIVVPFKVASSSAVIGGSKDIVPVLVAGPGYVLCWAIVDVELFFRSSTIFQVAKVFCRMEILKSHAYLAECNVWGEAALLTPPAPTLMATNYITVCIFGSDA